MIASFFFSSEHLRPTFLRRVAVKLQKTGNVRDDLALQPYRLSCRRSFIFCLMCAVLFLLGTVKAEALPRRIVSTSPSVTEILFALGLGLQVVGVSNYCEFPAEVTRLPKVGTYLNPDAELIAQLHPDLVLIHKLPNGLAGRLSALQITFAEVDRGTLMDAYTEIRQIGKAAGVESRAESLVNSIQSRLKQLRQQSQGMLTPTVVFVVHRTAGTLSNLVVVGRDSFMNEMIDAAGGKNVMALDSLPPYPHIGLETIIRMNPDVIIDLGDRGDMGPDRDKRAADNLALWRAVPDLRAVKTGRIYSLNSPVFTVPGPRTPEAAEMLFGILHGKKPQ